MIDKIKNIEVMLNGLYDGGDVTEAARSSIQYTINEAKKKALTLTSVVNWLPFIEENYKEFRKLVRKDTLILKFDDGTEIDHKEQNPVAIMTHFREA